MHLTFTLEKVVLFCYNFVYTVPRGFELCLSLEDVSSFVSVAL